MLITNCQRRCFTFKPSCSLLTGMYEINELLCHYWRKTLQFYFIIWFSCLLLKGHSIQKQKKKKVQVKLIRILISAPFHTVTRMHVRYGRWDLTFPRLYESLLTFLIDSVYIQGKKVKVPLHTLNRPSALKQCTLPAFLQFEYFL